MEDNSKLFVFEKKEVALIFIFIILIAIISFTLGVRTGKKLSLKQDDYIQEDIKNIDLKSVDEESVEATVKVGGPDSSSSFENSLGADANGEGNSVGSMEDRLKEEMKKLADEDSVTVQEDTTIAEPSVKPSVEAENTEDKTDLYNQKSDYKGKYTIQLFANQNKTTAQDFADGFILKGYDVIVNEVIIAGKGKWYRVSVGVFDTVNQAKDYLQKEKDLFQGKKYIINQF